MNHPACDTLGVPLEVRHADHFGDSVVRITFTDGSTTWMSVKQYDAIIEQGYEIATRDR